MTAIGKWWRNRSGSVAVEYALAFPLIVMLTLGTIELGLMMLLDASLEIGIAEASRSGSLTGLGTEAARKQRVEDIVKSWVGRWVPGTTTITVESFVYPNLEDANRPTWVDRNSNDSCDPGEGTCPPTGVRLIPGVGLSGSLVLYQVKLSRKGFTGVFGMAGINSLDFSRQALVVNE